MAEYTLPDGKILNVPDSATQEDLVNLRKNLAEIYPDHYGQEEAASERKTLGSVVEQTGEALRGIPRGTANTFLSGLKGWSEASDLGEDNERTEKLANVIKYINADPKADSKQAMSDINKSAFRTDTKLGLASLALTFMKDKAGREESLLAPKEEYRDAYTTRLGEGLGSGGAFIATALTPGIGLPAVAGLATGTGIDRQSALIDAARAEGKEVTREQEIKAKIGGGFIGLLEMANPLRIFNMFKYVKKSVKTPLYKQMLIEGAKQGTVEAIQETVSSILQDATANGLYDAELDPWDSMYDDATIGGPVGFLIGAGSKAGHYQMQKDAALSDELQASNEYDKEEKAQDEIIKQKVILAEQQGNQIIDPNLVPDEITEDIQVEKTVGDNIIEPPVLETYTFVPNEDGSVNVLGRITGESIGVFSNIEEASSAATKATKDKKNEFIVSSALQASSINGLLGNGTATRIGQKLYNPQHNYIDAKVLANFDANISDKRKNQVKIEQKIEENEAEGRKKLASTLIDGMDTDGLSLEELAVVKQNLENTLEDSAKAYPIDGNKVDPSSTLGMFWTKANKTKIGKKNFYTLAEAKSLLNTADFNQFMSERSAIKFKKIEATGEVIPVQRIKGKADTSQKELDAAFDSKNIEVDYNSSAFQFLAEQFTGSKKLGSMTIGQKEMLLAQVKGLPRFNTKTKLPNYTPRVYTESQMNDFYNMLQNKNITDADIKLGIKNNETGANLTPKQIKEFKEDLINSGRADKVKGKVKISNDFALRQSRKSESYSNETTQEFSERLRRTTLLTPEEIDNVINDDASYKEGVIEAKEVLQLAPPENDKKYEWLVKKVRERLDGRNLKDVGFALDKAMKASLLLKQKGNKTFYEPADLDKSKGKPTSVYDKPLNKIITLIDAINPDGSRTEAEMEEEIFNQIDHETYHALLQLGLIKQKEHNILVRDAKRILPKDFQKKLIATYGGKKNVADSVIDEELVAEFIRISINSPKQLAPASKTIIQKIINTITTFAQTIYDAGFTSSRTIIRDIESGIIGERERGPMRNYRNFRDYQERRFGGLVFGETFGSELEEKYANTPSFNRQELSKLQDRLYRLKSEYNQEYSIMSNRNAIKMKNKIYETEQEIQRLEREEPSFKRITDDELNDIQLAGLKKFKKGMMSSIADGVAEMQKVRLQYVASGVYGPFKIGRRFITEHFGTDRIYEITDQSITRSRKNLPYNPVIKVKMVGGKIDRSNEFSPEIGDETTMTVRYMSEEGDGIDIPPGMENMPGIKGDTLFSLIENNPDYVKFYDGPKAIEETPSFNRSGLTPENLIFLEGDIENEVYKVWRDNNKNPTAKDFKDLHKILAPQSKRKHDFKDYAELKKDVRRAVKMQYDDKWYARWGMSMPSIVGPANMHEFSGIFGITSAQATPEQNLKDSLRAMIIARKVDPVKNRKKFVQELIKAGVGKGTKQRAEALANFYQSGIFERKGSSQKTITYALEILSQSQGEFTPFIVIDRHMLRKFGLDADSSSATEIDYRIVQTINSLLSAENYTVDGEVRTFTPPEIQALLWADQRYTGTTAAKITNEGSFDSAAQASQREINEIKEMEKKGLFSKDNPFAGHFVSAPKYSSNKQTDIFSTDLQQNMYESIINLAPEVIVSFKSGRQRGFLPQTLESPIDFDTWNNFQNDSIRAITSGDKIKFLLNLGINHSISRSSATSEGELIPNIVVKLPGADPLVQKAVAAVLTDAFMQDAAIVARPTPNSAKTGLMLTKPENGRFSKEELDTLLQSLSQVVREGRPLEFRVNSTEKAGIILSDPKELSGTYTKQDATEFVQLIQSAIAGSGIKVNKYGQESILIEYGTGTDNTGGTRGSLRELTNRIGFTSTSDLQRTALRDLYIPLYQEYKKLGNEVGFEINNVPAYLEEDSALNGILDFSVQDVAETEAKLNSILEKTPDGVMPRWNPAANPVSLKIAFDYQEGIEPSIPLDTPSYSRKDRVIPDKYKDIDERVNGEHNTPDESFASSIIDIIEFKEKFDTTFSKARAHFIDEFTLQEKTIVELGKSSNKLRELNSRAISGALQSLRFSKKAQSIVSQMFLRGVPVLVDEKGNRVPKEIKNFGGTKVLDFKYGGFVKIFGQLHTQDTNIDLMNLWKIYSISQRGTRLNEEGIEVLLTEEELELGRQIGEDFDIIKKVYSEYQEYNNAILDYAVQTGILNEDITENTLRQNIIEKTIKKGGWKAKSQFDRKQLREMNREQLLEVAVLENLSRELGNKIEVRGTAQIWKENADYYPFYRKMADDSVKGPSVAGGFLAGNPLSMELKGSKEAISPDPLEVMARNIQSIINASMKNEGLARLMKVYEEGGIAERILLKDTADAKNLGSDVMSIFENGEKVYYRIADPIFTFGLQAMGMTGEASNFMKFVGLPANILRESITRDPGFIIKNMLRDTISSYVTSGASYVPILATLKNFSADLSELEAYGIIGGYDAQNDKKGIVKRINKIKREQGLDIYDEDGNIAVKQIVKLWDYMGGLTTRSDGATRKAVADSILAVTGDQVEAAYQGLEIINFDRRGFNPQWRIVTTAIPFLNARVQGMDVLYRAGTGKYSSTISTQDLKQSHDEIAKSIALTLAFRGTMLSIITGLYYAIYGDDKEYENERQSTRDDYWIFPNPANRDLPPLKFPIPFEVGFLFKVIPERLIDFTMTELDNSEYGSTTSKQLEDSIYRGLKTTLKIDPLGFQLTKPITEVLANKSGFTGNEIVPPYIEDGLEPQFQSNINTSSIAIQIGKTFNVSPMKVDYVLKGYGGTLGGYVLSIIDSSIRLATGRDYVSKEIAQQPILKSILASPNGSGFQEQFYEMRTYSNMVIQTINKLDKEDRVDELDAFIKAHQGALDTRGDVLKIDKYMKKYRAYKREIQSDDRLNANQKRDEIIKLNLDRDMRLAEVPDLYKETNQASYIEGVFKN